MKRVHRRWHSMVDQWSDNVFAKVVLRLLYGSTLLIGGLFVLVGGYALAMAAIFFDPNSAQSWSTNDILIIILYFGIFLIGWIMIFLGIHGFTCTYKKAIF